ncbi:MAG: hypothetical protein H0U60_10915 [Blastocatellia bacterium]|nr:hypothetical protein [Blastocatellia bacterium]
MTHLTALKTASGFQTVLRLICLAFLLVLVVHSATAQTTSNVDGSTPSGLTRGAPAGSYSLSGFEDINLFNGNVDAKLPLLSIGGRGTPGTTLMLPFNLKRWHVENYESAYYSSHIPQPAWLGMEVGYGPGIVEGRYGAVQTRQCRRNYSPYDYYTVSKYTFTTLTFKTPDGTEHELRDELTNGQPLTSTACNTSWGPTRGTVFISSQG